MTEPSVKALRARVAELERRLGETEQALEAIRTGQVESLVVEGPRGPRIYSLEWSVYSYRVLVEAMSEGAVTMGEDGLVLYCNARFAKMLLAPLERVMGNPMQQWVPERWRPTFDALLRKATICEARVELCLLSTGGLEIPTYLSASTIQDYGQRVFCMVAADLRAEPLEVTPSEPAL